MTEKILHKQICQYLKLAYPSVMFNSDLSGSMRLTIGQAVQIKSLRSGRGYPDIVIYEPKGDYHGLFIELKKEGTNILNKSGQPSTPHITEQQECMIKLAERGYFCAFAVGWDSAKQTIDDYLHQKF